MLPVLAWCLLWWVGLKGGQPRLPSLHSHSTQPQHTATHVSTSTGHQGPHMPPTLPIVMLVYADHLWLWCGPCVVLPLHETQRDTPHTRRHSHSASGVAAVAAPTKLLNILPSFSFLCMPPSTKDSLPSRALVGPTCDLMSGLPWRAVWGELVTTIPDLTCNLRSFARALFLMTFASLACLVALATS